MTLDLNRVKSPGRRLAAALILAVAGLGLAGCGDDVSVSSSGGNNGSAGTVHANISGVITDTNGNQLAGARITAIVNAKALGGKAATSYTVETVANGHFVIPNVPVVNVVNPNGGCTAPATGCNGTVAGSALTISIEAPSGYLGATAHVSPQAQAVSSENGGLIQGGQTNPQLVWFDGFNADAGTIELPATIGTITGILRNGVTGAAISGFPMRLTFEQVQLDQYGQGSNDCEDEQGDASECNGGTTGVVVSYASGAEQRILTETAGTGTVAGRFFFTNVPADSCVRIYAPGLNFVDVNGGAGQDFGGAVCDDQDEAGSVSYIAISTNDDFVQLNRIFATNSETADTIAPEVIDVGNAGNDTTGTCIGQQFGSGSFTSAQGNVLTVTFSEPIVINEALLNGANPVVVLVGNPPNVTSIEVESIAAGPDGRSLVITVADTDPDTPGVQGLPSGTQVLVQIPVESITDQNGNNVIDGALGFDGIIQTVNNGSVENQVLALCFNVFQPNQVPGQVDVDQLGDAAQDAEVVNADSLLFQSSSALADFVLTDEVDDATVDENGDPVATPDFAGIDQINGPDQLADPAPSAPDPSDELTALATALSGLVVPTDETTVINTTARVHVSNAGGAPFPDGTTVVIALQDPQTLRAKDVGFWVVNTGSGDPEVIDVICPAAGPCPTPAKALPLQVSNNGRHWYVIDPNGATDFDVIIAGEDTSAAFSENVSDGDLVHVISRDSSRTLISTDDTPVWDNVRPAVSLQLLGLSNGVVSLTEFGEGGTVVINNPANTGTVVLPITPQIADDIDPGTGCGTPNGTATGYSSDDFHDETYLPSGLADAGIPDALLPDSNGNCRADTDATGMAFFLGPNGSSRDNVTAIAVTEEVELTGAAFPAYTGDAVLSDFEVHNHTPTEDYVVNGTGDRRDLVEFNVDDVFELQADARASDNQSISLAGAIRDTTSGPANVADDTAQVLLRDRFPPMVTLAFFDGTNIVIVFNEPVILDGSVFLDTCGQTINLDYDANVGTGQISLNAGAIGNNVAGTVVTIPTDNFVEQTGAQPGTCFSNAPEFLYSEAAYANLPAGLTDLGTLADPQRHGYLSYGGVQDTQGNAWDCGPAGAACAGATGANTANFDWSDVELGIGAPRFAMADILGPFQPTVSAAQSNFSTGANGAIAGQAVNYNVSFSHPFFLTDSAPGESGDDFFGDDADEAPYGDDDGIVENVELVAWASAKFQYFDSTSGTFLAPTGGVQVLDSNGDDVLVGGNDQDARTIILSFIMINPVAADDRIEMVPGEGITSALDPLQNVRPFDEGPGNEPNSDPGQAVGDGDNNTNELQELAPYPQEGEAICPQVDFGGPEEDNC